MRRYLIVYRKRNGDPRNIYFALESRNAMKHMEEKDAQTVWVYDQNGFWVSFADRKDDGKPYRPQMFPDGEPRIFNAILLQQIIERERRK